MTGYQTIEAAALAYVQRGWKPLPVARQNKKPIGKEWQKRAYDPKQFNGNAQNIGIQLGEVSKGLTDVDLDSMTAIGLALEFLPTTKAMFGRRSKPCSHQLYLTDLYKTEKHAVLKYEDTGGVIVELRVGGNGKGAVTTFPPSLHVTGEAVQWVSDGEPARIAGDALKRAVLQLAVACVLKPNIPARDHGMRARSCSAASWRAPDGVLVSRARRATQRQGTTIHRSDGGANDPACAHRTPTEVVAKPVCRNRKATTMTIELTGFAKANNGVLTKRISLAADGSVLSDGSACKMSFGTAQRLRITGIHELAAVIANVRPYEAIALGALRGGLPDKVQVVTKQKLNGQPNTIARTADDISFLKKKPAIALLDFDAKGMPPTVATAMKRLGSFWQTLLTVLPALAPVAHIIRRSTSAGLFRADTGERLPGSRGIHAYLTVCDGSDIERFLRALHERCWLNGLGWMMVSAGGQLLERSIVDRMVGAPERLVFEGDPILDPPLQQDRESRRPILFDGEILDTLAACPPLSIVEKSKLSTLKTKEAHRLAGESANARASFIKAQAKQLVERTGMSEQAATEEITRQCEGVLRPVIALPFDDEEFAGCTVGDVLADPERFEGATLADPLEGVAYGTCKARIMRHNYGAPWIHSFAHGRTVYQLKHNLNTARAAIEAAKDNEGIVKTFLKLAATADLGADEIEQLRNEVAERTGMSKRTLTQMLRAAQQAQAAQHRQEQQARRIAERDDPRPIIRRPVEDTPWLPLMTVLNDVIGACTSRHPPARDIDATAAYAGKIVVPAMHAFSRSSANGEQDQKESLPPPEEWLIRRMTEIQLAEVIERYIDFVDDDGRSVHLPTKFVRHYLQRDDGALPSLVAVATLPLVLADGQVLTEDKFDRLRGIDFRLQPEVAATVPQSGSVTDAAIKAAMNFLTNEWLVDVTTDYAGKCTIIAAGLTIIERSLLDQRPAFFVTAGRRGGGKTTTLIMLIKAVTGIWPAAAAWSSSEEERRKALLSYFMYGVPYILWDNIERGSQISCPHIEKSCTAAYYADRKLGVSEMVATAASSIHLFTGNNIGPRGDLASRSLEIRLDVGRHDPENREFKHPDPIGWTDNMRARILSALYTILLGNPTLKQPWNAAMRTRFKMWYRLVGSAVEHAAELTKRERDAEPKRDPGEPERKVDFQKLFLDRDEDDEDSTSLAEALAIMVYKWSKATPFNASEVARFVNDQSDPHGAVLREFLYPGAATNLAVTSISVGKRLKTHLDEPVRRGKRTLILRAKRNEGAGGKGRHAYFVKVQDD